MSWQDRERERYEERLRERWTADGKRLPQMTVKDRAVIAQIEAQIRASQVPRPNTGWGMPSETYLQHVDKYHAELYTSTREICGND